MGKVDGWILRKKIYGSSGSKNKEETKRKMSLAKSGIPRTEETKRKLHIANRGKKKSKESIKKLSITRKRLFKEGKLVHPLYGKHHIEETKRKIGLANKGKKRTQEFKENVSRILTGKICKEDTKRKIGEANSINMVNLWKREEYRKNQIKRISLGYIKFWKNDEFRNKRVKSIFKGMNIKPNKPEKIIIEIIKENNLPFNYVGDGQVIMGGFNPDFISKNPKQIIEFNGDYWHNLPNIKERDKRKYETYKKLGYQTLIIWENELKDINNILNKIKEFMGNGKKIDEKNNI